MIQIYNGKDDIEKIQSILERTQMDSEDVLKRVDEILEDVRIRGDEAVLELSRMYDRHNLDSLRVTKEEIEKAKKNIDKDLEKAINKAIDNITAFHKKQLVEDFFIEEGEDILLGQLTYPIENVGIYVPGGTAAYPSTVMMNAIPAKIAGVENIVMVTPANSEGKIKDSVLVAADLIGVNQIYKVGGAQAIGGLCFGTETIPKVDKIVGPGNIYVAMAKRKVLGLVGIDMIAGPSEVLVLADDGANPKYIAADLIAQSEHDMRAAAIVVTDSMELAKRVQKEIGAQLKNLERNEIAAKSLSDYGAIIVVEEREEMFEIANRLAPEHLEILTKDYLNDYKKIKNAGAIFLGEYSPEPVGDYYAGPNHTLPTSRTARFSSALGVYDFCKKTSLIYYSKEALKGASKDIINIANDEGLTGHANSIRVRMED